MYALQPRLEVPRGKRALRLLEQPRFRAAFDLLALRAQLGLAPAAMASWWTRLQEASPEQRVTLVDALSKPRRPAAPLAGGSPESAAPPSEASALDTQEGDAGADVTARGGHRRRRRRRFRGSA